MKILPIVTLDFNDQVVVRMTYTAICAMAQHHGLPLLERKDKDKAYYYLLHDSVVYLAVVSDGNQ